MPRLLISESLFSRGREACNDIRNILCFFFLNLAGLNFQPFAEHLCLVDYLSDLTFSSGHEKSSGLQNCTHHDDLLVIDNLKVLSSEIDLAESMFFRNVFIKERSAEVPPILQDPFKDSAPPRTKAVGRGDKTTRRVRVLALLEHPRRDRVRVLALLENPRQDRVLGSSSPRKPSPRTSTRSLVRGSRLVSGHPRPRSMDRGTRTRMSIDESRASNH